MQHKILSRYLACLVLTVGCSGNDPVNDGTDAINTTSQSSVSTCGGFAATHQAEFNPDMTSPYCQKERLRWSYASDTDELTVTDERFITNCCGNRTMTARQEGDVYVLEERDEPKDGNRCRCTCAVDLKIVIPGIAGGRQKIRLVRIIPDQSSTPKEIYSAEFDLAQGQGDVVVDEQSAGPGCDTATGNPGIEETFSPQPSGTRGGTDVGLVIGGAASPNYAMRGGKQRFYLYLYNFEGTATDVELTGSIDWIDKLNIESILRADNYAYGGSCSTAAPLQLGDFFCTVPSLGWGQRAFIYVEAQIKANAPENQMSTNLHLISRTQNQSLAFKDRNSRTIVTQIR